MSDIDWSGWKQPIPTNLERIFGNDYDVIALFKELIYRSANKDKPWKFGRKVVFLKRGQTVFGRNKYAQYLGWSDSKVERVFQRFIEFSDSYPNKLADIQRDNNYTIVTIKNYDQVVGFEQVTEQVTEQQATQQAIQQANTSKSVKSVESVENKEIKNKEKNRSAGITTERLSDGRTKVYRDGELISIKAAEEKW